MGPSFSDAVDEPKQLSTDSPLPCPACYQPDSEVNWNITVKLYRTYRRECQCGALSARTFLRLTTPGTQCHGAGAVNVEATY